MLSEIKKTTLLFSLVLAVLLAAQSVAVAQSPKQKITFDDHIKSLLNRRCSACHNSNRREGDLDVTTYINLMQGGGSGTVLESKDVDSSYLYALVTHEDSPEMPPSGNKIPASEIKLIADWINGGLLETASSKAATSKPKVNLTLTAAPTARPAITPMPMRMPLQPAFTPQVGSVAAMVSNPWAPVLAVSTPKQILLYRTDRLELAGILDNPAAIARSMMFSRNGQFLIAGGGRDGESGRSLLFDVRTGELKSTLGDERDAVLAADLSPNQATVAIGGPSKLVNLISLNDESKQQLKRHTGWVTALQFSPDGKFLATADRNGGLLIWEAGSGAFIQKLDGHPKSITSISWRSDSQFFVSSGEDGALKIWNPEQPKAVKSWGAHGGGALTAGYRRDGTIFSAGRDRLVKLWKADGKAIRTFKGLGDIVVAAAACDETDRIFAADWTGKMLAWNVASEKPIKTLTANPPTIQQRLKRANSNLAKARAQLKTIDKTVATTQDSLASLQKSLQTNAVTMKKVNQQITNMEKWHVWVQRQARKNMAAQYRRISEIRDGNVKLTKLSRALAAMDLAVEALPNDQVLGDSKKHLTLQVNRAKAKKNALPDQMQFWQREGVRLSELLVVARQKLKDAVDGKGKLVQQRKNLNKQISAIQTALGKQQAASTAAKKDYVRWQQQVARWTGEQKFIQVLSQLEAQKLTAKQKLEQHNPIVQEAKAGLQEAAEALEKAERAAAEKRSKIKAIESQIEKLRSPEKSIVSPGPVASITR